MLVEVTFEKGNAPSKALHLHELLLILFYTLKEWIFGENMQICFLRETEKKRVIPLSCLYDKYEAS